MTHGTKEQARTASPHAYQGHQEDRSLHGSGPEDRPTTAIAVSVGLLGLWLGITVFAHPLGRLVAEVLTRIELRWMAWTP